MSQKTGEAEKADIEEYPSWYGNQTVISTDSLVYAYATALDGDSASAITKAEKWAESELKTSISDKLENIRKKAAEEYDPEYEFNSSQFLIALREADDAVGDLVKTLNTQTKTVEGYNSYRSFAEISVPREELVQQIGERLSEYEETWNAMKDSKAFEDF